MAGSPRQAGATAESPSVSRQQLEQRLFASVGPARLTEAQEVLTIGRLSWRLRDDDNLLLARLEAQLLEALGIAAERLNARGRLDNSHETAGEQDARIIAAALKDPKPVKVRLSGPKPDKANESGVSPAEAPRQLVGQPAAPGMATGVVRIIEHARDLAHFKAGEVLVCQAIEPTMTHLVPLARAIVERRGGMLIHGAIIARELGIPCVNGIPDVVALLDNGDLVTVDGYLGVVTVGAPEFDIEGVSLDRPVVPVQNGPGNGTNAGS